MRAQKQWAGWAGLAEETLWAGTVLASGVHTLGEDPRGGRVFFPSRPWRGGEEARPGWE